MKINIKDLLLITMVIILLGLVVFLKVEMINFKTQLNQFFNEITVTIDGSKCYRIRGDRVIFYDKLVDLYSERVKSFQIK